MAMSARTRLSIARWHLGAISAAAAVFFVFGFVEIAFAPPAEALPSFARQTGQPCGTCHTDFPALTPFGRRFKLLGYTVGGGLFRTTPFPAFAENARAQAAKMGMYLKAPGAAPSDDKEYVPPVSTMAIIGFTHTQAPLPPPTDPFKPNDNVVVSPFSGFWGGAITDDIGLFAQVTYGGPPAGGFGDPFGHTWGWDNTDLRFVKAVTIGGFNAIFGITANNKPDGPGRMEHHARLGLPLRLIDHCRNAFRRDSHRRHFRGACSRRGSLCLHQRSALSGGNILSDARFRGAKRAWRRPL
jgi:hypothetical protein